MIANITQGSYTKGLLQYHENKVEEGVANIFFANSFLNTDIKGIEKTLFAYNIKSKRKDKNIHISLNFTEEDYKSLTIDKQETIIKDYMNGLGFPQEHPYITYLHKDKKHPHFHIVTSKILADGKALNDKFLFVKSQKLTRKLETKYNLTEVSSVKSDKNQNVSSTLNNQEINNYYGSYINKELSLNEYLLNTLNQVLKNNKPKNITDLTSLLNPYHIDLHTTNHRNKGIVFRLDNESRGVAASYLSKEYIYTNLEKKFKENQNNTKDQVLFIANKIDYIFYKYDKLNIPTYTSELAKHNIALNVNETNGVIRGFSYSYEGATYKGQDLPSRKYTMGKIQHKFSKINAYNDLYRVKFLFQKNSESFDYKDYQSFIKSVLAHRIKPVIFNSNIYLIPIESKQKPFDDSNSIKITDFEIPLKNISYEKEQQMQSVIDTYVDTSLNTIDYNDKEEFESVGFDLFDEVFETLNENNKSEGQESPTNKRKRKKRKKRF